MQKIISLFARNYDGDRLVRDEVVPGAEWVLAGEGRATVKFDGTCCLVRDGKLYKRYDAKRGKPPPAGFEPAQDPDPVTGHWPGWVLVGTGPEDQWHREALAHYKPSAETLLSCIPLDGTYELIGPKVQGNPYRLTHHTLQPHGGAELCNVPREFAGLRAWLATNAIEGIVWHHPDGRMVKVKRKDFGLPWPPK